MKKQVIATIAGAVALACLGSQALAQSRDLNVVSWGGAYQDGQKDELEVGCDEGLYEKLDVSKIGGASRYLPGTVHACGVGAIIYNLVLAYDGDKMKTAPNGWSDFFDTKKIPGKRSIRNGAKWNLEVALIADGVYSKDDVVMTTAYNGRITAANEKDKKNFKIVWKDTPYTMDSWVIMKGTPQKANAEKLVEFMGRPENQAKLPKFVRYGVTAAAAAPLIDKSLMGDLPTNPDNLKLAFAEDVKFWIDNGDKLAERWTKWAGTK